LNREYGLNDIERWDFSQDTGQLVFSEHEIPTLIASVDVVGTYSHDSHTFKWAWDNPQIDARLTTFAQRAREVGAVKHYDDLIVGQWDGTEEDAWAMGAIELYLSRGLGLYAPKIGAGRMFLLIKSIEQVHPRSNRSM